MRAVLMMSLMVLAVGCPGPIQQDTTDASGISPLTVGSEHTLEIATWSVSDFPMIPGTPAALAGLLEGLDLDLVAVQDITSEAAWDVVKALLPSHGSILSQDVYSDGTYQKTGFLWRRGLIELVEAEHLHLVNRTIFPRSPLQARFIATRPNGGQLSFTAIVVHLSGSNDARRLAVTALDDHIQSLTEDNVVLLGDFGGGPGDTMSYHVVTEGLADVGECSLIQGCAFVDHIILTEGLLQEYTGGRALVVPLDRDPDPPWPTYDYAAHISGHLPVVAIFP